MQKFFIFLFIPLLYCVIFSGLTNSVNATPTIESYFPILTKMLIFMLKNCDFKPGSMIINYDDDILIQSLWNSELINFPLIQWQGNFPSTTSGVPPEIIAFIINLNTTMDDFKKILANYQNTPWWDVMDPFFIVYKVASGCKDASRFLKTVSKMNLIMTYFLCLDSELKPTVYIFNPYSNIPNRHWIPVISNVKQYDRWTSFYRAHTGDYDFCTELFFDRTLNLNGALLKITMPFSFNPEHEVALEAGKTYNESILQLPLFPQMASMATTIMDNMNLSLEIVFENMPLNVAIDPARLFRRLNKRTADLSLYPTSPTIGDKLSVTNPSIFSAYYIMAVRTGQQSIVEKIIKFYSVWIFVLTLIIILIIISVIMKVTHKSLSYAVLEIIRLFIGTSIVTPLVKQPMRIFFCVILIYFLILQATFLGRFKTFLTSVVQRNNVERIDDLAENYVKRFATTVSSSSLIQDDQLKHKNIVTDDAFECIEKVITNQASACLEDYMFLLEPSLQYNLHLSRFPISYNYYTYVTRDDWPLKKRLDILLLHIRESGFSELWTQQLTEGFVIEAERRAARATVYVKPLTLDSFVFAFQLLMMGLIISFILFVFEVWSGYEKDQILNPTKPIHRFITHKNLRDFILNKKTKKPIADKKTKENGSKKVKLVVRGDVSYNKIRAVVATKEMTLEPIGVRISVRENPEKMITKLKKNKK